MSGYLLSDGIAIGDFSRIDTTSNTGTISSGTAFNCVGGVPLAAGVYIFSLHVQNSKTNAAGSISQLQLGISTSSTTFSGGFAWVVKGYSPYTSGGGETIIGMLTYTFRVPSSATYYFLQQMSYSGFTPSNTTSTWIQFTRIG